MTSDVRWQPSGPASYGASRGEPEGNYTKGDKTMGIDAEIMIRYRGEKPSDDQLNRWSWDIASAIGAFGFG